MKMKTACLRIKFTPLLQNIQKEDSKHCLEIVPEITCIQNLDKIQWKKEENSIEYTIPMTYKIILRKKHVIKDNKEALEDKTYHSCVDLLLPSSDSNFMALGSGDVSRIQSDTFVLTKVTTDVQKCSIVLKEASAENKNDELNKAMTAQVQTEGNRKLFFADQLVNNERMVMTDYKSRENALTQTFSEVQSESHNIQVPNADIGHFIKESIDKITNTEVSSSVEVDTASLEEVDRVLTINSKTETKRNLSLTPICSINTDDNQTGTASQIASNTIVYVRYETQKEFARADIGRNAIESDDLYFSVCKRNNNKLCKTSKQYNCVTSHRVHPEVRVANFIQIMEKEIMPLKVMLSDIISKCSSLGFSWKKSQQNPIIYKNVPICDKQISRCLKTKKQTDSNRVVYSVVFDG